MGGRRRRRRRRRRGSIVIGWRTPEIFIVKSLTDSNKCFYRICLSRIIEGRSVRRLAVIHTLTYHKMTKRQTDKNNCHLFHNVCHRADFCRGDELVP